VTNEAPGDLELLRSFANTREIDTQTDALDSPDRLHDWLVERSLLDPGVHIDTTTHVEALEFREAVRALGLSNTGADLDPTAVATMNRLADRTALSVRMSPDGCAELQAGGSGVDHTLARLFSIMYTAMIDDRFARLEGCANDTCGWLFYDHSKNRSKKWCHMQSCGNMLNARAYRQRQR
jgi:predicted RNA-binding Zn ribbon-like protein